MKFRIACLALSGLLISGASIGQTNSTRLVADARIVEFEYNPEKIYPVLTRPFAVTNIELPKGDPVVTMMAGDTSSFIININKARNEIFIKPKFEGIETTLTVISDKKRYQFYIRSTGQGKKYYQQVSFAKEEETFYEFGDSVSTSGNENLTSEDLASKNKIASGPTIEPDKLYVTYTIEGDANFKPINVYDNGTQMWLKFPSSLGELPAIFGKSEDGLYLVNYRVAGENLVNIQQLAKQLILKIDSQEVVVKRGKPTLFGWRE